MSEYTEGVCEDGAAILRDGVPMTIDEILDRLRYSDMMESVSIKLQYSIDHLRILAKYSAPPKPNQ